MTGGRAAEPRAASATQRANALAAVTRQAYVPQQAASGSHAPAANALAAATPSATPTPTNGPAKAPLRTQLKCLAPEGKLFDGDTSKRHLGFEVPSCNFLAISHVASSLNY